MPTQRFFHHQKGEPTRNTPQNALPPARPVTIGYNGETLQIRTNSQLIQPGTLGPFVGGTPSPVPFRFWGSPVYQTRDGIYLCPGYVGQTFANNSWDFLKLGASQDKTPGIAKVTCDKSRDLDKKKSPGNDGARITLHGAEPGIIQIQLLIWTPDQLVVLNKFWQTYMPIAGKATTKGKNPMPSPVDVSHPLLAIHGVKSIQVVGGSGPDQGPVVGSRVFTVRAIEFLPITEQPSQTYSPFYSQQSIHDVNVLDFLNPGFVPSVPQ